MDRNKIGQVLPVVMLSGFFGLQATAATPTADYGRQLFEGRTLAGPGGAGSCSSCHPGGKGLENGWRNPNLTGTINTCITGPLKGKALQPGSLEMQSLRLYIESLKPAVK